MRKRKNTVLEKIRVEQYAAEGRSLARVEGKVIFIENTVPGDVVDARLFKNKKDWAEGYPLAFHEYSELRVEPFCTHFGVCGGCQWQMLPYEKQLQYKQEQVEETLKRIGKIELPKSLPIIGASETRFYRNKLEYTFSNRRFLLNSELHDAAISAEADVAGFHAKGIFDKVIDIKTCYLQQEPSNALRTAVRDFAVSNQYSFYDIRAHKGFMRTMQLRTCTTGEVMVNLVFGYDDAEKRERLLNFILDRFPGITTLLYTINSKWNDSLNDLEPVTYFGKGYVIETMSAAPGEPEFRFKIGPTSFFQTNTRQAEQLYRTVREFGEWNGNEIVYDLYCGTGSIGIYLSRVAGKIVGVEMIEAAVQDARENAALNNAGSAEFFMGDVVDICVDDFFATHGRPGVIITDPPRAGMHRALVEKLLDLSVPTVIYVSCNPATQARDLNLLSEKYTVTKIQPVDMFPHTHHIENVVLLKLK